MKLFILTIFLTGCFLKQQPAPVEEVFEPVLTPEIEPEIVSLPVKIEPPKPDVVRWPRDQDLKFTIAYCSDVKLQLQWRQVCGSFDSDWYDMIEKGMVDPLDADFMMIGATKFISADCLDTVVVMGAKMRNFPKSGCEWSFRTRLISKRNVYPWVMLGERIVLADPGEFEAINLPKIELIKPGEKANFQD